MSTTFTNHYKAGHSYEETWETTDVYCPDCGKQSVWHDCGGGDYYVDEEHICIACAYTFHLPYSHPIGDDHNGLQRLRALRAASSARDAQ